MKYAVDRIEDGIIVLENLTTKEIMVMESEYFPEVKESDIVIYENGTFYKDTNYTQKRKEELRAKMERLKERGREE